ncbi:TPA: hypothetical protein DF272_02415 [Candidatus Falkowbacteria bacterium]|nr:hypothetical protein [Candidatus Falkowbacteria bacterium]
MAVPVKKRWKVLLFGAINGRHHLILNAFLGPFTEHGYKFKIEGAFGRFGHYQPEMVSRDDYDFVFVPVTDKVLDFWSMTESSLRLQTNFPAVVLCRNGVNIKFPLPASLVDRPMVNEAVTDVEILKFAISLGLPRELV